MYVIPYENFVDLMYAMICICYKYCKQVMSNLRQTYCQTLKWIIEILEGVT